MKLTLDAVTSGYGGIPIVREVSLAAIDGNEDVRNIYLGASGTMAVRGRHH